VSGSVRCIRRTGARADGPADNPRGRGCHSPTARVGRSHRVRRGGLDYERLDSNLGTRVAPSDGSPPLRGSRLRVRGERAHPFRCRGPHRWKHGHGLDHQNQLSPHRETTEGQRGQGHVMHGASHLKHGAGQLKHDPGDVRHGPSDVRHGPSEGHHVPGDGRHGSGRSHDKPADAHRIPPLLRCGLAGYTRILRPEIRCFTAFLRQPSAARCGFGRLRDGSPPVTQVPAVVRHGSVEVRRVPLGDRCIPEEVRRGLGLAH
jgi:hypothetical protein